MRLLIQSSSTHCKKVPTSRKNESTALDSKTKSTLLLKSHAATFHEGGVQILFKLRHERRDVGSLFDLSQDALVSSHRLHQRYCVRVELVGLHRIYKNTSTLEET